MNLKRKCKVIMLPANEKATNIHINLSDKMNFVLTDKLIKTPGTYFNLYILSDEKIEKEDWYYTPIKRSIEQCVKQRLIIKDGENDVEQFKIIASTDKSLNLPEPSPEFIQKYIEAYNSGNPITEVIVEYEDFIASNPIWNSKNPLSNVIVRPKVNKSNQISITKVKDSWSREEVIQFAAKYARKVQEDNILNGWKPMHNDNWISKNL